MKAYYVYLGDVFLKCFRTEHEAFILSKGLEIFLAMHDMDVDMVRIVEEVV